MMHSPGRLWRLASAVIPAVACGACFGGPKGEALNAPPFSADLINSRESNQPPTHVYVGSGRLRLESTRDGKTTAFVFAPQNGTVLVIDEQAKSYIDAGMMAPLVTAGMYPLLRLFRPAGDADPCTAWNGTVNQFAAFTRSKEAPPHFSCSPAGTGAVDGRPAHKWTVTSTGGNDNSNSGPSTVWIDDKLHLLTKSVDNNGSMEMHNVKEGEPSPDLFGPPSGYQKVGMTDLLKSMGGKQGGTGS